MKARPYPKPADLACAAALRIGALRREGTTWKFGRRRYSNETARRAVLQGIGVQHGDELRAATPTQYPSAPRPLSSARGVAT